jgi:hypothetical protein
MHAVGVNPDSDVIDKNSRPTSIIIRERRYKWLNCDKLSLIHQTAEGVRENRVEVKVTSALYIRGSHFIRFDQ